MNPVPVLVAASIAFLAVPVLRAQDTPKAKPTVYDEAADGRQQVAAALAKAKKDNQRVLIQWGGNWCGWCILLHDAMKADRALSRKVLYEYQVVHVDTGKNKDLAKELGAEFKSVPFLTILDADGKPLVQQHTEPFETKVDGKPGHDAKKLVEFLTQHEAKPLVAADVLAAAMAAAKQANKRVFLHFGAPWCGWCHRLEDWMAQAEVAAVLGKDFVDVKVDNDRMTGGKDVYEAWVQAAGQEASGIPWFVLLDGDGKVLAHSTGPKGNVGFPYKPEEVDHFVTMLNTVKVNLTDGDIAMLKKSLDENREREEAKKKAREAQREVTPPAKTGPV